ncbi:CmpA/NrtA family ABC transporter substrate-binding protein [Parathermosynechococcus lividus]|jgi:nitrate/nitrite transport system substrate-binding protein|uniref:Bicarbonate-binding protein n=1 Tax=Parathermosynechococcus lividus PCC 6715 TaxID=1917166 RepID=A0A2D2Q318_PARLV|nr:CmpA/NrtA family ABC transporter substrate-binding protein [Thermostichus lividus]ATS18913.1 bicarbonate-binding protein [Thermostichus lividus PCC 6715]
MTHFSRRRFLVTAAATTAVTLLSHGCSSNQQTAGEGQPTTVAETPEVTTAKLGFIALTDAAPLIIAKEKGYFAKYGMPDVEVLKQASWGVTRDNLVLGSAGGGIDGAHILTPMPYLMTAGTITDGKKVPMYILARLNTNGQGILLANTYKDLKVGTDSSPLKEAFAKTKAQGKEVKVAVTFPGGTHDLWMRYWLAAGGIDPDKDVSLIVVPPPQMVANMKTGTMEAFCVGEPWPLQTVNQQVGVGAITTGELWQDHPEKSFALRADWVDQHPKAAKALLMAVMEAQQWCDQDSNKPEMAQILSKREWFKVPVEDILDRSLGKFNFGNGRTLEDTNLMQKYWRDSASYPYQSHDLWFLTEDIRWGYLPADTDTAALIKAVNREDLWREAAKALGVPAAEIPTTTSRGVETFFNGVAFDPQNPQAYLSSLTFKKV